MNAFSFLLWVIFFWLVSGWFFSFIFGFGFGDCVVLGFLWGFLFVLGACVVAFCMGWWDFLRFLVGWCFFVLMLLPLYCLASEVLSSLSFQKSICLQSYSNFHKSQMMSILLESLQKDKHTATSVLYLD